jgi:hypothetical protein
LKGSGRDKTPVNWMSLGTRELNIASLMFIPGIETKNHEAYNTHEGIILMRVIFDNMSEQN